MNIVEKLRAHVEGRNGPVLENGAWQLMLDAADRIEELEKHFAEIFGGPLKVQEKAWKEKAWKRGRDRGNFLDGHKFGLEDTIAKMEKE